jgi:hypothetical protein
MTSIESTNYRKKGCLKKTIGNVKSKHMFIGFYRIENQAPPSDAHCVSYAEEHRYCGTGTLVYSPPMRRISVPILVFAFVSFIAMQMSGSHLHAELAGQIEHAESHDPLLQRTYFDHEDHDGVHIDVEILDSVTAAFKDDVALQSNEFTRPSVARTLTSLRVIPNATPQFRDYSRWRPPLRAPPLQTS